MLQDLPELILELVCDRLSYEDVLALRSTCKGLKVFVDGKQFTKLNLLVKKFWFHHRLFYTDEPIGYPHSFHSDDLTILNSNRFKKRFAFLQKMTICNQMFWLDRDATEFHLNNLNCFEKLSHLEINEFPCIKGRLDLQELAIAAFQIHNRPGRHSSFELNCPRLRALSIKFFRPVLTDNTDQLDYLYYFDDYSDPRPGPMYVLKRDYLKSISPNLRNLSTICFGKNDDLLRFFSDLETGSLSVPSLTRIRLERCVCFQQLDELLVRLEDLKREPHTNHIEFTFNGRSIRFPDELREIASLIRAYETEARLYSYSDFNTKFDLYILQDPLLWFLKETPKLEFLFSVACQLFLCTDIGLNEEMIKKLKNIRSLTLNSGCKPSESTFELFARTCKSLRYLSLFNQTVTERLLEMLSNHLGNLHKIEIFRCKYETMKPLAKFRNLEWVELDFDPLREEFIFIYENSRSLEIVSISFFHSIWLQRTTTSPKMHRIVIANESLHEFKTLYSMIDYYEGSCEKNPILGSSTRIDPLVS